MTAEYLKAVQQPGQQVNRLFRHLGVNITHLDQQAAVLQCDIGEELLQGAGVLAGGILATLADEAMAHAVLARLQPQQRTATVEMSVRYLRPVHAGDVATARAWVLKQGRSIATAEAEVRDSQGRLAVKAAASFMVLG